jgi:hypothetical protein
MHERAVADQLLENFFGHLAFGHAGVEQDDADVEEIVFGYRLRGRAQRHRMSDDDLGAGARGEPRASHQ